MAQELPPLPKSLRGVLDDCSSECGNRDNKITEENNEESTAPIGYSNENPIDARMEDKLEQLRNEMASLREQDVSLLSQLWSLNESLQELKLAMRSSDTASECSSYMDLNLDVVIPTIEEHEYENEEFLSTTHYENEMVEEAMKKDKEEREGAAAEDEDFYEPVYIGTTGTLTKKSK